MFYETPFESFVLKVVLPLLIGGMVVMAFLGVASEIFRALA